MQKVSQLYWAISKLDPAKNSDVDNFLMINECDIYKDYFSQEFEWRSIREAGREYVVKNKKNFPLRFEFMQQLKVTDYDFEREGFGVLEEFKIFGTRRFEILTKDAMQPICNHKGNIEGYPKGLIIELSRPFSVMFVPVEPEAAEAYISSKASTFKSLDARHQTQSNLYDIRNVYLVMKIKVFAYKGKARTAEGMDLASVLAVLEGYEIYGDANKDTLLYSASFRRKKKPSVDEKKMFEQYEASKQQQQQEEKVAQ